MKRLSGILILAVLGLSACGADGPPVAPDRNADRKVSLLVTPQGVTPTLELGQGPVTVRIGG